MNVSALLLASACSAAPILCAQQVSPQATLSVKTIISAESTLSQPMAPMKSAICDGAGNIYAIQPFTRTDLRLPQIQKITRDAKLAASFRVPETGPGEVRDGFVDHDGKAYLLAITPLETHVLAFAPGGSLLTTTKLELPPRSVEPWHLAVFRSGGYLLVGQTGIHEARTPFTAVFAKDGKLIKKIYEPEDEEARQKGELNAQPLTIVRNDNNFVISGEAASGSDGNVYLLRGGYPALVYVISPTGDVLRKLRIDAGNRELVANSIKSYAGRLAIGFGWLGGVHQNLIKVLDLEGNPIADYEVGSDEYSMLACYDSEGFTMIPAHSENKLHLLKAKLP